MSVLSKKKLIFMTQIKKVGLYIEFKKSKKVRKAVSVMKEDIQALG